MSAASVIDTSWLFAKLARVEDALGIDLRLVIYADGSGRVQDNSKDAADVFQFDELHGLTDFLNRFRSKGAPAIAHAYRSTACRHGVHGGCRGACKYCHSACVCECHTPPSGRAA